MLFEIFQLIIIFHIATDTEGRNMEARGRAKHPTIFQQQHFTKQRAGFPNFVEHEKFLEKERKLEISQRNPEENRVPKSRPSSKDTFRKKTVQSLDLPRMMSHSAMGNSFSIHRFNERKVYVPEMQHNDRNSFDYFIYKINGESKDLVDPVKTQDIPKEVCKTVPFSQNIIHENCDKVVIQNNLCFGTCNSLYVPNQGRQLNNCSHCHPFKFTMNHLKLNCTGSRNVVKAIMMVEECKCVFHRYNNQGTVSVNISGNSAGHHKEPELVVDP